MGVTLKELLDHYGLQESQLDQRCTNAHLNRIALHMDKWVVYASFLGLTPADIDDIKEDSQLNLEKKIQALNKWKQKFGNKATFRFLVDVFLESDNAELAEEVLSLIDEETEAVVTFDYEKKEPDELNLRRGHVIKNVVEVDEGWCEGVLNGVKGMFPSNFVEMRKVMHKVMRKVAKKEDKSSRSRRAKVIFSYAAEHDDELTLAPGMIIEGITEEEEGWWRGRVNGREGVFPNNFVEEILEDEEVMKPPSPELYTVIFNYRADDDDELSISVGDVVEIVKKFDSGWWKVRLGDKTGLVLNNYIEPLVSTPEGLDEENEKHLDAVKKAMERKGTLDHTIMQGVYLGPARSGKSSLIKRLTGEGPSSISPSTGVAEEPCHIQVRQSYSVPLSVTDSIWFKLTYNTEAVDLLRRISHFFSSQQVNLAQSLNVGLDPKSLGKTNSLPDGYNKSLPEDSNRPQTTLPEGYKPPLEILRAATSGEDVSSYLENSWSLYLTDTGGQMEFQELLPLLVSGPSVFFITFRLNQDLTQLFTIQYELADGNKSEPYESTLTLLEAILTSLASISSMGTFVYKGLQKQSVPIRPKVFFVGTHKDQLDPATAEKQIQEIDQYLQKVIMSTSHYRDGLVEFASPTQLIFTVNNLAQDDEDFRRIRLAVEKLVQRGEFKVSSPSHWLVFSLVIRYLKSRIISFEECLSVAKKCGITDEAELKEALFYLHTKLGVVRYFPVEGLNSIVVKDPQLLFDKVTELIVRTFTFENVGKHSTDEFKKKGIFSLEDFERIARDSNPLLTPTLLVELLKYLRIVVPFKTEDGEIRYFIPCVLSHAKPSHSSMSQQSEIHPLVVTFKCGYCPKGIAGSLIVYLLGNEMDSEFEWSLQTDEIFRDQVSFLVGPDFDTITLTILPTNIKITCIPAAQASDRDCNIEEVCDEVQSAVVKGVEKVTSDMNYLNSAKHSVTFECPCDDVTCKDPHVAEMSWHKGKPSKLLCRQTQKRFPLPSSCKVWFGEPLLTSHPINPTVSTTPSGATYSPLPTPRGSQQSSHTILADEATCLHETFRLMLPVASEWQNIGVLLKISSGTLATIARDNQKSNDCLREMLSGWLQQVHHSATWKTDLAKAIEPFDPSVSQTVKNMQ